jgi:hypothetical protein
VRPRHPIMILLAASPAVTGCGGAPASLATPPPAMEEYKYHELPAECFPGYRHLVDEFARPMINQLDDVCVNSLIDSRPVRAIVPPYKEADVSDCSASFFRYDDLPTGSPRQRSVNVELHFRNDFPHLGTTEQQVQSLYRITMSKLDPDVQVHELALGDEGVSWFDDSSREPLRLGHALVRDGNLWVNVTADGTDVGSDGQNRSIPAAEAEAAAAAAAALASVQR